jgi:hypothetical protein
MLAWYRARVWTYTHTLTRNTPHWLHTHPRNTHLHTPLVAYTPHKHTLTHPIGYTHTPQTHTYTPHWFPTNTHLHTPLQLYTHPPNTHLHTPLVIQLYIHPTNTHLHIPLATHTPHKHNTPPRVCCLWEFSNLKFSSRCVEIATLWTVITYNLKWSRRETVLYCCVNPNSQKIELLKALFARYRQVHLCAHEQL